MGQLRSALVLQKVCTELASMQQRPCWWPALLQDTKLALNVRYGGLLTGVWPPVCCSHGQAGRQDSPALGPGATRLHQMQCCDWPTCDELTMSALHGPRLGQELEGAMQTWSVCFTWAALHLLSS